MTQEPIYCDGFRVRNDREFVIRTNVDHVAHCVRAIRQKWANESQLVLSSSNVVDLTQERVRAKVRT